jgi:hypothetical protein
MECSGNRGSYSKCRLYSKQEDCFSQYLSGYRVKIVERCSFEKSLSQIDMSAIADRGLPDAVAGQRSSLNNAD